MSFKTKALTIAACMAVTFSAAAADLQNNKTLNVFYYSGSDKFVNNLATEIKSVAGTLGYDVRQHDAGGDLPVQLNQIEDSIVVGNDILLVNPVDTKSGTGAVKIAKDNRVPVIFFNRAPSDKAVDSYDNAWYVGTNAEESGRYQAELIKEYVAKHQGVDKNGDGVISIVLLKGEASHQDTEARTSTLITELMDKSTTKFKIIEAVNCDWSLSEAAAQMQNIISTKGLDNVEMIVSNNDSMALGAITAINSAGYNTGSADKFIPVFGIDGIPDARKAIEEHKMSGTVLNDYVAMAKTVVKMADALLNGKQVNKDLLDLVVVNRRVMIPYGKISAED